jgi:hypothetical protein
MKKLGKLKKKIILKKLLLILKDEGFIPNYKIKLYSNPYWIQAEKYI